MSGHFQRFKIPVPLRRMSAVSVTVYIVSEGDLDKNDMDVQGWKKIKEG